MPRVTKIPATLTQYTAMPIAAPRKRRVAAYARVSTDHEEQQTSYEAQVDYYTNYIQGRSDWEFAGIYADEGITGTSIKHREGFKRMIQDALDGKIDLIVTKSVSRFARNTVDSLTTIRNLKEKGVECFFEKENIWTFDGTLGKICDIKDGTHQTPHYVESGIPFYSVETVTNDDFTHVKYITREEHERLTSSYKIENGDILMTRIGSIGKGK